MNGHTQAGIDATQPDDEQAFAAWHAMTGRWDWDDETDTAELHQKCEAKVDALNAELDAERYARHMDAMQFQARIAELERQVAELTAWRDAVPVEAIQRLFGNESPYMVHRECMVKVESWLDSLDAQSAADDAAMAKWDAGN